MIDVQLYSEHPLGVAQDFNYVFLGETPTKTREPLILRAKAIDLLAEMVISEGAYRPKAHRVVSLKRREIIGRVVRVPVEQDKIAAFLKSYESARQERVERFDNAPRETPRFILETG